MNDNSILYLSATDIQKLLPMPAAIASMRRAFAALSAGEVQAPVRVNIPTAQHGQALFMPVYCESLAAASIKTVTVTPGNAERGLPLIHAMVSLFETKTGRQTAPIDGEFLTALRTGAASGLATDLLAREEAKAAFIFGAGAQAATQIAAICAVRDLQKIWIFDRDFAKAEKLAILIGEKFEVECNAEPNREKLPQADIVCTVTTARQPVFAAEEIQPGAHINGIGSYTPDMCEIPAQLLGNARVFVDQRAACLAEAGDILQAIAAGEIADGSKLPEIGEIINKKAPGRQMENAITVFKSVGNAAQDLFSAHAIYEKAVAQGAGQKIDGKTI